MGPLIGLILLFIVIAALNDRFISPSNLSNLLRQVSINALISFGMTFVILTGGIDLSVGSILALSSALLASMITSGMNPEMAVIVAAVIGLGLGVVNGIIVAYGKVAPFIATLATMTIYRGATLVYTNGNPISGLSDDPIFMGLGQGDIAGVPVPAILMLIAFLVLLFILNKTPSAVRLTPWAATKSLLHRRHQDQPREDRLLRHHRPPLRACGRCPHLPPELRAAHRRHGL